MGKRKPKTGKKKKAKTDNAENNGIADLKKEIRHQKDALTKIIKTYTHEK